MISPQGHGSYPLPKHLPATTKCLQITIPDDPDFERLFYAAVENLTFWFAYDRDLPKTGKLVANLWKTAYNSIKPCPKPTIGNTGCDCGDCCCMSIRVQNCVLQQYDCVSQTWVDVYDLTKCIPNPAPGGGTTPPVAGKCQDYTINADSRTLTPLPFNVNTGDTIQMETIVGASTDGSGHWYCPDGEIFLLGACAGGGSTSPTDPLNTTFHQALLFKIGSAYYPITTSLFTVPSGVINAPIYIQTNTASLTNNVGSYKVEFNYCNNQSVTPGSWCHHLAFAGNPFGANAMVFQNGGACGHPTQAWGTWVSGTGFEGSDYQELDCATHASLLSMLIDMGGPTALTSAQIIGSLAKSSGNNSVSVTASNDPTFATGVTTLVFVGGDPAGTFNHTGTASVTARYVRVYVDNNPPNAGGPGLSICTDLYLHGTGTDPFGTPNC